MAIPVGVAIAAMIAGAYTQQRAQQMARDRQRDEIQRSLERQKQFQMEAEKKAMDTAQEFDTTNRAQQQGEIEQQVTQDLIAPVSESQAIRAQEQTTQGNVSGDYKTAKAAADLETMKRAEQLARLLGKTTASRRLRMGEGVKLMNAAQAVDQLGNFSRGQRAADEIGIAEAGNPNGNMMMMGSLLQAGGSAALMGGGNAAGAVGFGGNNGLGGSAPVFDRAADGSHVMVSKGSTFGNPFKGMWSR
jgi:hypothetical protein